MRGVRLVGLLSAVLTACADEKPTVEWPVVSLPRWVETGPVPDGEELAATHWREAARLRARLVAGAEDVDTFVWFGRRLAYVGRYEDAIEVYTRGLAVHAGEPHLLRHRGHRLITTRRFARAVADLEAAAKAIAGTADAVEPDGVPNSRGVPTSTLHTNVWYHLALAHYLRAEFADAADSWGRCLRAARNHDMEVAARYWLCLAWYRVGDVEQARSAVEVVRADWDVIENRTYQRLCLLFADRLSRADVAGESGDGRPGTVDYGLARWDIAHGEVEAGTESLRRIVRDGAFAAFGRIAAEADLNR